jgi:osmoprotectant transport system permease protein
VGPDSLSRYGRDPVAVLGSALGLVSLVLPWLSLRANRLAAGQDVFLFAFDVPAAIALLFLWSACLLAGLGLLTRRILVLAVGALALLPSTLITAGAGGAALLDGASDTARASLGAGVWVSLLASYVIIHTTRQQLIGPRAVRSVLAWGGLIAVLVAGLFGAFDDLSLMREFSLNEPRFLRETVRHLTLALGSVALGTSIAVPLGIFAARSRAVERPIFAVTSAVETIPSLALFGLIIAPLSALSYAYPALREMGIRGVGTAPAVIALVLYSLLPIVHNTFAGLRQVSPVAMDAGRGMGMSPRQLAWRVEFPLAVPLIGEGVRIASVQAVGGTTVAALIGAGGLGHFIFQGLGQAAPDLILLGALPVIGLALVVDACLAAFVRLLTPAGVGVEARK